MQKDPIIFLEHIHECNTQIKEYTKGFDENKFLLNLLAHQIKPIK